MHFFDQYEPFFRTLAPQALVLTPNQRMSRFVQAQHGLWRQKEGDVVWPSLHSVSFSVWVEQLWQVLQTSAAHPAASHMLLSAEQERILWVQAVEQSQHGFDLLADESMADLASQAWRYMRLWRKSLDELPGDTPEQTLLVDWVQRYSEICEQRRTLDTTAQLEVVAQCIADNILSPPAHLVLLGFDDINPLQQRVFDAAAQRGTTVTESDIRLPAICHRLALADTETELTTMARWAAAIVEKDAACSIGLVLPNLANLRPRVTRILNEVFEPQAVFADRPRHAPPFNISAAQPLAQTPLIASALTALQLNSHSIEGEQAQSILNSPFLFDEQELNGRVQLYERLRERYLKIPFTALRAMAGEADRESGQPPCPELHQRLHQFSSLAGHQRQRGFAAWAEVFDKQLQALGWPGQRPLDTLEYQQLEHWPELLTQLAALEQIHQPVTLAQALSQLARLAYTPFHAQTTDSPVQVLGLLEAAGLQFDYLWVMGLDNRVWPEPSKPNPLLPVDLQSRWQMPRASAERELQIAKRLTERLTASAHTVITSAPEVDGDQPLQPSPMVMHLPALDVTELELAEPINYQMLMTGQDLQQVVDEYAGEVAQVENLRGGTQILKNQAACPFKAFAKHRLTAQASEPLQPGITPIVRGNLLHRALEIIWRQLEHQRALLALTEEQLEQCISAAVTEAWRSIRGQELLGLQLKALEQQRAHSLLRAWLELEKQRPPFKVLFNEKALTYSVGGIPLVIRYDRIDELDDESLLVLDYKTGRTDIGAWAGERPDEPQVPLYTLAQGKRVEAAAYVQINAQEVAAKGIALQPEVLYGLQSPESLTRLDLPDTWQGIVEHWRSTLERLATEFLQGDAQVNPKSPNLTCRYCDLHSLCRIRSQINGNTGEEANGEQ